MQTDQQWEQKQAEERAERARLIAERVARFDKIAGLLGLGEAEEREEDTFRAFRAYKWRDGARIAFVSGGYGLGWDRVEVSGWRPRDANGVYVTVYDADNQTLHDTKANMILTKTDTQLANEIQRRVIVPFGYVMLKVLERIESANTYERETRETLERVKGAKLPEDDLKRYKFTEWDDEKPSIHVRASRKSVYLEINYLDVETAQKIMDIARQGGRGDI